ncbi:right-handed parallel beta-helix repeat-containing protein [Roseobacter sp. N2S]|uniref:right-handed parallel beta-helix repeat-containing protein n=1 Tax=Roseobacter sp. N2S TaxID=2663844 RepID=UPI00285A658C|nr:right-handed parallel beta-helix repeat-containing protein [Roseobacter sp. N2S]MDR6266533.1 hypothetical protein [Roseobacter sp. N2S]
MSVRYTKDQIDSLASFIAAKIKDRIGGFRVDSVAELVESERPSQGLGTLWSAGDMLFQEAGPLAVDHHLTTSSGVKLYEAGAKYTARSRFVQAVAREFPFTTNEYVHAEGFWYTYDGGAHIVDLDGFSPAISTVLNPKQFAARGNGIADDLVPIKAMLAYGATIAVIAYWSPEGKNPAEQRIIYDFSGSVYAVSGEILLEAENSYSLIKNPQIIAIAGSWSTTGTDVIQLKAPGSDFTVKLDSYIFKMKVGCGYVTFLYPDLNCNGLCGGIFARGRAVVYRPDIRRIGYTHGALEGSVGIWAALGDVHIRDGWVGQWDQSDAEYFDKDAYGAIGLYTADSDITVIGTKFRWSYANIVLSGTNHRFVQIHSFNGMRSYSWSERNAADAEMLDEYFGFDTSAYNFPVRTYHSGVHAVAKTLESANNKFSDSTFEDCYFDNCHMETEADGVVFRNPKLGAKPTSSLSAPGAAYIDGTPVSPEGTIDYWWNNHAYEDNAVPRLAVYGVQPYVEGTVKKAIKWTDTDDFSWAKDGAAWEALNDNLMDETHGDGFRMGSAHTNLNTDNSRASVLYYSLGDNSAIRFADDATSRNVAGDELDAFTLIGSTGDHLKLRASMGSVYTGNVLPALLGNSANGFVVGSGTSGVVAVDDDADDLIIQNGSDAGISVAVPRDNDVRFRAVTRNAADDGDEVRGELQFDTSEDLVKLKVNETDVADFGPAGKATSVKPYFAALIAQSNGDGNQYASGGNMEANRHCYAWDQDSSGNPMVAGTQFLPAEIGTAPYNSTEIGTGDPVNYFSLHTMKHIQETRGGETYLVQVAQGSTPIEAWMHDDDLAANGWTLGGSFQDLYPFMINALTAARADVPGTPDFLDLIMFCHGNANSDDSADLYAYKVQVVLDRLVTEGFASYESTKVLVGELAHGSAADTYKGTRQQKALRRLANNPDKTNKFDVGIIPTRGLNVTNSTPAHFTGEALVQLGYRYGRAALASEEAPDDYSDPDRFNPNYGLNWAVKEAFVQNRELFRRPPENLGDVPVTTENSHAVLGTCYKAAAGDAIVLSDRLVQPVPQGGVRISMEAAVDGASNESDFTVCVHQWDGDGNHVGLLNVPNPKFVTVVGDTGRQVISKTFVNPLGGVAGDAVFADDARYFSACFRAGILSTGDDSYFNVLGYDALPETDLAPIFDTREAAEDAVIGAKVNRIGVKTPTGDILWHKRDVLTLYPSLNTGGGAQWSPDGDVFADHWADNTTFGTTDMADAIIAAASYAGSTGSPAQGAQNVNFFGCQYHVSKTVPINDNFVTLVGQGARPTLISCNGDIGDIIHFTADDPTTNSLGSVGMRNIAIRNFADSNSGAAIRLTRVIHCYFDNINIEDHFGGILVEGGIDHYYSNIHIFSDRLWGSVKTGSYLWKFSEGPSAQQITPADIFITNVNVRSATGNFYIENGFVINCIDGLWISNGHALSCDKSAVHIEPVITALSTGGTQVTGLMFSNFWFDTGCTYGLRIKGTTTKGFGTFNFSNSQFLTPSTYGVYVESGCNIKNVNFTGGCALKAGSAGMYFAGGQTFNVSGMFISGNGASGLLSGIALAGSVTDVCISGNTIGGDLPGGTSTTQTRGVYVNSASVDRVAITGNQFSGHTDASIKDDHSGTNKVYSGNSVDDTYTGITDVGGSLQLPAYGEFFTVNSSVSSIANLIRRFDRRMITIMFTAACTVTHTTGQLELNGSVNFVAANKNTLTLVYTGSYWVEVSRKT